MIGRRSLLIGGALGLALAGLGYRAWDRGVGAEGEGPAYEPWRDWKGAPQDGLLRPLRAAILAANPHDTQPWAFAVGQEEIEVFADRSRNLGSFDPFRREMHLGLGAAIENLTLAARAYGMRAAVEPAEGVLGFSPDDAPVRAARLALEPGEGARDALFAAIPLRHTNRGPYRRDRPVAADQLRRLADVAAGGDVRVAFVAEEPARRDLGALIVEATRAIVDDAEMSADSARWFRTGRREIAARRDGVTLDAAGLSPRIAALAKLLPDMSAKTSDAYWLAMTRDVQVPTAPALGIVFVRDRLDIAGAIAAGRAWQRLHLAATAAGLAAQPLNQPVERADRDKASGRPDDFGRELMKFAAEPGWEATFVFRMGVPERAAPASPRRPLEEVVRA
jgi:nitroreductase